MSGGGGRLRASMSGKQQGSGGKFVWKTKILIHLAAWKNLSRTRARMPVRIDCRQDLFVVFIR